MGPCDPERFALEADAENLLEKHEKRWRSAIPKTGAKIVFERGFPHRFTLQLPKFLEQGDALLAAAPTLAVYTPTKHAAVWDKFVKSPLLGRLRGLEIESRIGMGRTVSLLSSPLVAGLRSLGLPDAAVRQKGAESLIGSPYLANLRRLGFYNNRLGDTLLGKLAASPRLPSLVALDVAKNGLSATGVGALARSPMARRLEQLTLKEERGGDDVARAFAEGE
jgi:hypothetical protein